MSTREIGEFDREVLERLLLKIIKKEYAVPDNEDLELFWELGMEWDVTTLEGATVFATKK